MYQWCPLVLDQRPKVVQESLLLEQTGAMIPFLLTRQPSTVFCVSPMRRFTTFPNKLCLLQDPNSSQPTVSRCWQFSSNRTWKNDNMHFFLLWMLKALASASDPLPANAGQAAHTSRSASGPSMLSCSVPCLAYIPCFNLRPGLKASCVMLIVKCWGC